jgi:TonB-linked SusC/RagA family outer membrane protein
MKTILSSDYFLSRIVKILGEIGFVPGCLILLVLMAMSSFASAHHLPNSLKDHESFDLKTSALFNVTAHKKNISELTPGLDEEHPHGGRISYPTFPSKLHCQPNEGRISSPPLTSTFYPITGTIYDAGGGIPGVVVKIKGTNIFTITDEFGQFQINAKKGDILIFSFPDYETVEIKITDQTEINLELFPAVTQLEEAVINAGYYTVKDKERTGSIYKVTAKEIENQPVNNVLDALQGRVPSLDITPTTGLAGGGYTVRIRGQNSIDAGNEPLYVIDGVPFDMGSLSYPQLSGRVLPKGSISPLNFISPQSIESIEILKDADATAIYGSRGANGVILITTKQGKQGKTRWTIDAATSFNQVTIMQDLLSTEDYLKIREQAFLNDGITEYPLNAYDINGTWDKTRYTNWQKILIGNIANSHRVSSSISGGNENIRFNLGADIMKETSIFYGKHKYQRQNFYSSFHHTSRNKKFSLSFTGSYGLDNNNLPKSDLTYLSTYLPPNAPPLFDENGNLNWENNTWTNPLAALNSTYKNNTQTFLTNTVLKYELIEGLHFSTNLGYTWTGFNEIQLNPHTMYNPAWGLDSSASNVLKNNATRNSWIIEPQMNYQKELGLTSLNVTLGGSLQKQNYTSLSLLGTGFISDEFIDEIKAANTIEIINDIKSQYNYAALFARLNLNHDNKYFLNLTGRRDGSSRFGPNNRFANFGAIGLAWIFSKENFFNSDNIINFGKLRASYGITGNDQIGDYQFLDTYSISDNGYNGSIGLIPTRLYNPNFSWEKNQKLEIAFEFALLNIIKMEVNYYRNISNNLLINIPLPSTTGFNSINSNLNASVVNSGFDIQLSSTNLNNSTLKWNSNFLLNIPNNKLLSFEDLEKSTYKNNLVIGEPINIYKLYKFKGQNSTTGLYEFEDYNNDGEISPLDQQFVADLSPKFSIGFSNTLSIRNFQIDIFLQYVNKSAFSDIYGTEPPGFLRNQPASILNSTHLQPFTTGQNFDAYMSHSQYTQSDAAISNGSFLRLKSLNISYKIPIRESSVYLYIQGQNLLTFTSLKGIDPEQYPGYLPPLKKFQTGVKLEF